VADPIEDVVKKLQLQAGSRGFTFAGRVGKAGDTARSVMGRMPMGSGEGDIPSALNATIGAAAPMLTQSALGKIMLAGMAKTFRPQRQVAEYASDTSQPMVPSRQMWPAWGNPRTGEVHHSMQAAPYGGWHEPNTPMKMVGKQLVPDAGWDRGHVDPMTWKFYPEDHPAFGGGSAPQTSSLGVEGLRLSPYMGAGER